MGEQHQPPPAVTVGLGQALGQLSRNAAKQQGWVWELRVSPWSIPRAAAATSALCPCCVLLGESRCHLPGEASCVVRASPGLVLEGENSP